MRPTHHTREGDVHAYEVDAMKKIREVFEAKVSIEDVILMRVMRSFEGKSKTIQHKIADDINSPEGITENTNVFDMVHGYCRALATVGDGKSHPVKTVNDDVVCHKCNENPRLRFLSSHSPTCQDFGRG